MKQDFFPQQKRRERERGFWGDGGEGGGLGGRVNFTKKEPTSPPGDTSGETKPHGESLEVLLAHETVSGQETQWALLHRIIVCQPKRWL